ncbi:MAG: sigma 54-interacting transcriptional regulator [candidate division Zixibacteria bacterium]|nr:sigma 54-interacting transcriptional regulator [candidate division Zixibacteria bacterium]
MEIRLKGIETPSKGRIKPIQSLVEQGEFAQALRKIQKTERDPGVNLSPGERGDIHYLASFCLFNLGRYKEALDKATLAFNTFKDTSENKKVAQIQDILGRIHWGLGDLKNAELCIRDAITTYRRIRDYIAIVRCNNTIARILFTKCDFGKAAEYLNEAKELSCSINSPITEATILGNLGRIHTLLGNWEQAKEELKIGLQANSTRSNAIGQCKDQLSLGYIFALKREFTQAKAYLSSAFQLAQKNNYLRETVIYHEYMGELCFDQGIYREAEDHYNQIINIWENNAPDGDMISQTYRLLAELQVAQKQFDQAFISCQKSLKVSKSLGEKIEEGAVYRILGQIYFVKREKGKSRESFEKSMSLLQQVGAKYELAKTYLQAGRSNSFDYYKRLGFLSNAESLFRELNSKFHLGLVNLAITDLLVEQKDYGKAHIFLAEAERLFKESNDQKELRQIRNLKHSIEDTLFQSCMIAKSDGRVTFDNVVTHNTEMREIVEKLKQIKDYDISILLEGETGTGKDVLAKAIHYSSRRKDKRFVAVNCAALPESLLENELFGHKRGAYTGADKDQPGLFEEAEGGTLYLDQVEEIPTSTQVKLLRAIEEKEITRLGGTKPRKIDVRIISSSIDDLKEAVKNGKFRQDLYFRLNTFDITIPPLRDRKEDIPLLVRHFLKEYGVDEKRIKEFERNGTLRRFSDYGWPGNVRELENEIKRMVVLAQAGDKDPSGFLSEKLGHPTGSQILSNEPSLFHQVAEFEKEKIIEALSQSNWIKLRAARLLGIPEATIRNKIKKYKISPPALASKNLN